MLLLFSDQLARFKTAIFLLTMLNYSHAFPFSKFLNFRFQHLHTFPFHSRNQIDRLGFHSHFKCSKNFYLLHHNEKDNSVLHDDHRAIEDEDDIGEALALTIRMVNSFKKREGSEISDFTDQIIHQKILQSVAEVCNIAIQEGENKNWVKDSHSEQLNMISEIQKFSEKYSLRQRTGYLDPSSEALKQWDKQNGARRNTSAFSHLQLAHRMWEEVCELGDTVIDATAGQGFDTVKLAKLVLGESKPFSGGKGKIYAIDVQEKALEITKEKVLLEFEPKVLEHLNLIHGSHETFPQDLAFGTVKLIVYNLGFLPGSAKSIQTSPASTLKSLTSACSLICRGGLISIMCYKGHSGGPAETEAVKQFVAKLDPSKWRVFIHEPGNQPMAPILITALKG